MSRLVDQMSCDDRALRHLRRVSDNGVPWMLNEFFAQRNSGIVAAHEAGATQIQIAEIVGLTQARVSQIVNAGVGTTIT